MTRLGAALVAATALCFASGCRESTPEITGVRIEARFAPQTVRQLRLELSIAGTTLAQVARPDPAGAALSSPQDLVVYLPDARAGADAVCVVVGVMPAGTNMRGMGQVRVERRRVVTCVASLGAGDGGAVSDAGGDAIAGDAAGAETGRDGGPTDTLAPPRDTAVDQQPPQADGPGPPPADTNGPPPDAPEPIPDTNQPPPDAPAPPPDMMEPLASGCSDGFREGFIDIPDFPGVAGCGMGNAPVSYVQAKAMAGAICAPGWRWCRPGDVGALPASPAPRSVQGASCAWLDASPSTCQDKVQAFGQPTCGGAVTRSASAGAVDQGACTGLLACNEPWKLVVPLDRWTEVSALDRGACQNHVTLECATRTLGLGDLPCWVACCRGP
jgi:hypothetical protein